MAVWAHRDCVFDGVEAAICKPNFVMNFQVGCVIAGSNKRSGPIAPFTNSIRAFKHFGYDVWTSDKGNGRSLVEGGWDVLRRQARRALRAR
jgi:hypothetical protein